MKRFLAMLMIFFGGIILIWGGYYLMAGAGIVQIPLTEQRIAPMYAGLAGLAMFTLGLIGYRE
jgi:TRAP-type C4-dicarboxylate transport system permease small subunit